MPVVMPLQDNTRKERLYFHFYGMGGVDMATLEYMSYHCEIHYCGENAPCAVSAP